MGKSKNYLSVEELRIEASKEEWNDLWVILLAHTIKRLIYRFGKKGSSSSLKEEAEQKLSEVLSLVLVDGSRNWNIEHYPTLKDFLISVIDSHLDNSFKKSKPLEMVVEFLPDYESVISIEDELSYLEQRKIAYEFLELNGASDEEILIFECMADGVVKPNAIKQELGISDGDFHNYWRRLKTKLEKLKKKISENE